MRRILLVVLLLLGAFLLGGCSGPNQMPKEMPADFNFEFRYGIGAKNELNTFTGQYTKDLIAAGTATTSLTLSAEEMAQIYYEMQKMNIMGYPEIYEPGTIAFLQPEVTPYSTYYFKLSYGGQTKEITWHDKNLANVDGARNMRSLAATINHIVEAKAEYQELPPAEGGYN